jgi:hypothetical protein
MGSLSGVFTADDGDVRDAIGKRVYFGEVLGKHSDISIDLTTDCFIELTDDLNFIEKFDEFGCESGLNPLTYLSYMDEK